MKRFRLYKRIKIRKRKRKQEKRIPIRKQKGGIFAFEYLINKLAHRRPPPNNSLYKALEQYV